MTQFSPFGFPQFDPSKMDPKLLMQLSQLIQQLPPEHLQKMQTLMHNSMAGFDVRKDMEEFEKSLPPGFREKLMSLMASYGGGGSSPVSGSSPIIETQSSPVQDTKSSEMNLKDARLTILQAVADGRIPPEEAERLLFSEK